MQLLWIGLTACRSAFSIFIISALGRTVKSVLGAFAIYFRLIKCNMCSKVCSQKAKERKNQRSYALSFGAEDGTFPRANQQSTGLLVPALRCRRPVPTCGARIRLRVLCRLPSSTAAPAPAPCIRRRRRSPLQQVLSSEYQTKIPMAGYAHGDLCLVRKMGLEPTRHRHTHLKRACLPIPALPQIAFDCKKDSSTFGGIKSSPIL